MATSGVITKQSEEQARRSVPAHVEPKACFIWFADSKQGWKPIDGTGCAHYVAHRLNLKGGKLRCSAGYFCRVKELIATLTPVALANVAVNDVWANDALSHTGVVDSVDRSNPAVPKFTITHASSRLQRVSTNDWEYFGRKGKFYRSGAGASITPTKPVPTAKSLLPFGSINGLG